jgi:hypothetical protein
MAYFNLLLSVPAAELAALRADASYIAKYTEQTAVSHLLAYWIKTQPLGELLASAIDGGEPIHDKLWHPLRNPIFHQPAGVAKLHSEIAAAWQQVPSDEKTRHPFDYFGPEIERLLAVFKHAAANGECVVSILEPPADAERADRVSFPFTRIDNTKRPFSSSLFWLIASASLSLVLGYCWWRYRRFALKRASINGNRICL